MNQAMYRQLLDKQLQIKNEHPLGLEISLRTYAHPVLQKPVDARIGQQDRSTVSRIYDFRGIVGPREQSGNILPGVPKDGTSTQKNLQHGIGGQIMDSKIGILTSRDLWLCIYKPK